MGWRTAEDNEEPKLEQHPSVREHFRTQEEVHKLQGNGEVGQRNEEVTAGTPRVNRASTVALSTGYTRGMAHGDVGREGRGSGVLGRGSNRAGTPPAYLASWHLAIPSSIAKGPSSSHVQKGMLRGMGWSLSSSMEHRNSNPKHISRGSKQQLQETHFVRAVATANKEKIEAMLVACAEGDAATGCPWRRKRCTGVPLFRFPQSLKG